MSVIGEPFGHAEKLKLLCGSSQVPRDHTWMLRSGSPKRSVESA